VPALKMPVFFFIGRHDHVVAPETSAAYFESLTAPSKHFVWFEDSAHEPPVEEPAKFNALMVDLVRPVTVG
jgi:pimeloyl-ACP methyl ester carboxylesterase